jgi:CBS domain-containing protein
VIVKEFMSDVIITAECSTLVIDAAKLMAAEAVGSLIVTKDDVLVGLVTRSEIISAQLLSDDVYHTLKLEDIMETPVVTINPDADLGQIIALMDQCGCKHIPVIDGNEIIGIVTATDIIGVLATMKLIARASEP